MHNNIYCSPGRGEMAQDGKRRDGTFHGEMGRCRESQGWTTICSSIPKRDGKNKIDDKPKQAGSCWFASSYIPGGESLQQERVLLNT